MFQWRNPIHVLKGQDTFRPEKGDGEREYRGGKGRELYGLPFAYVYEMSSVNKTNGLINDGQDMPHLMQ